MPAGEHLSLVDLEGNQAVDCLLYNAHDTAERYCAPDTIAAQGSLFLTTGSVLRSSEGTPLMTVVADEVRPPRHHRRRVLEGVQHAALRPPHQAPARLRGELPRARARAGGWAKRDLVSNINWYMNVPVEADGTLGIVDGISAPGLRVTLRAEMDTLVLRLELPADQQPLQRLQPDAGPHVVVGPPA